MTTPTMRLNKAWMEYKAELMKAQEGELIPENEQKALRRAFMAGAYSMGTIMAEISVAGYSPEEEEFHIHALQAEFDAFLTLVKLGIA